MRENDQGKTATPVAWYFMNPAYEKELQIKKRNDAFTKWRKRTAKNMPELAARVFALRKRFYMGCGFHWGMEKSLGYILAKLNDYDDSRYYHSDNAISLHIALEVLVQELYHSVVKAEQSAIEWERNENKIS